MLQHTGLYMCDPLPQQGWSAHSTRAQRPESPWAMTAVWKSSDLLSVIEHLI